MKTEHCSECDQPTGKAGRSDDSIYKIREGEEIGPLCDSCLDLMWVCLDCSEIVPPNKVTFSELHEGCGGVCI